MKRLIKNYFDYFLVWFVAGTAMLTMFLILWAIFPKGAPPLWFFFAFAYGVPLILVVGIWGIIKLSDFLADKVDRW